MELNKFMNEIKSLKSLDTSEHTEKLCEFIRENINLITVRQWIQDMQLDSDDNELANLASLMEIHPLGFEKYVLWDDNSDGSRARLHYWPKNDWPFESIHDHRFNFCATVIKGHYVHEEYDVIENEDNNKVEIELTRKTIVNTGDAYFFKAGTFHRVLPSDEETISFLVRSGQQLPYSKVINPETLEMKYAYGAVKKFKSKLSALEVALN